VVITGRRENEGHQVVEEIKASGGDAIFVKTDVSKERDVAAMVRQTVATFGRLDFAFNNAGVQERRAPLAEQPDDAFDAVFDVNVRSLFLAMKAEIGLMLPAGSGVIINNASVSGLRNGFGLGGTFDHVRPRCQKYTSTSARSASNRRSVISVIVLRGGGAVHARHLAHARGDHG